LLQAGWFQGSFYLGIEAAKILINDQLVAQISNISAPEKQIVATSFQESFAHLPIATNVNRIKVIFSKKHHITFFGKIFDHFIIIQPTSH